MEQKFKKAFTTSSKVAIEAICEMMEKIQEPFLVVNETLPINGGGPAIGFNLYVKDTFLDSDGFDRIKGVGVNREPLFHRAA